MKKIKKILNSMREFFWPLLEKGEMNKSSTLYTVDELVIDESNLDLALSSVVKIFESEEDRKRIVETKSSIFIGTISVITSVILGVTTVLVTKTNFNFIIVSLVVLLFVITIYMSRTIWYSILALQRRTYFSLSLEDYINAGNNVSYKRELICKIANKIQMNYSTINAKVDNMTMAQEYFKRAIISVVIYAVLVLLLVLTQADYRVQEYIKNGIKFIETSSPGFWNSFIIYTLLLWCIILSLRANIKYRAKKDIE